MDRRIKGKPRCSRQGWPLLLFAGALSVHFMEAAITGKDDTASAFPTEDTASAVLTIENSSSLTYSQFSEAQTASPISPHKDSPNVPIVPSQSAWSTSGDLSQSLADAFVKSSVVEQTQREGLDDGTGSGQVSWEQGANGSHFMSEVQGGLRVTSPPLTTDLDQELVGCLGCQGAEQELEEEPPSLTSTSTQQVAIPGLHPIKGVEGSGETFGSTGSTTAFKEKQDTKLSISEVATNVTTQGAEESTNYTRADPLGTTPALEPLTTNEPSQVPTDYNYDSNNNTTIGSFDKFPIIEAPDIPMTSSNIESTEDYLPDLPALTIGPDVSISDIKMTTLYYWEEVSIELEDENELRLTTVSPKVQTMLTKEEATNIQTVPNQDFQSESFLKENAFTGSSDLDSRHDASLSPPVLGENGSECKLGYVKQNKSCKSICDMVPSYCYNGGQCYVMDNVGAICRCNAQDYIWHKGIRCEFIITEFQVMCIAVGSSAVVILLLFMLTVFFAKKVYSLKTENKKLRKRRMM
ncbi:uncharacterized protein [Chiloscyllium punctatum]|uniref:uncharacterized protein isoform X2 n=1 Tax=Chiloscyllium punctatum TaxID=137246 RepID=UPI003B631D6F